MLALNDTYSVTFESLYLYFSLFTEKEELGTCLNYIAREQRKLCSDAAGSTLFAAKLMRRLTLLKRHVVAVKRSAAAAQLSRTTWAETPSTAQSPLMSGQLYLSKKGKGKPCFRPEEGLARLGSRAALSFVFAFLKRAWRSGARKIQIEGSQPRICSPLYYLSFESM